MVINCIVEWLNKSLRNLFTFILTTHLLQNYITKDGKVNEFLMGGEKKTPINL